MSVLSPTAAPDRKRRERVAHVERAEQRQLEAANRLASATNAERGRGALDPEIVRLPVGAVRDSKSLDPALCAARQRSRFGVVRPEEEKAAPWNQVDEALKGDADRREIGIDVGVIELDVVDHADVREVLEELRGLVEERAVVLVPLDHELAATSNPVAALEVLGNAADEDTGICTAVCQEPPGQRGRRRLAMRARDHDRPRPPEEVIAHGFGQRAVAESCDPGPLRARGCRGRSHCPPPPGRCPR